MLLPGALASALGVALLIVGLGRVDSACADGLALRAEIALLLTPRSEVRSLARRSPLPDTPMLLKLDESGIGNDAEKAQDDAMALLFEAIAQHRQGALAAAEALYRRVLALPTPPIQAHLGLARILARRAGAKAAAEYLDAAQANTADAVLAREAALWWVEAGEYEHALASLQKTHPRSRAEDGALLGGLYLLTARYEEAVAAFRHALAQSDANPGWWLGLGFALYAAGERENAQTAWQNALNRGGLPPGAASYVQARLAQR